MYLLYRCEDIHGPREYLCKDGLWRKFTDALESGKHEDRGLCVFLSEQEMQAVADAFPHGDCWHYPALQIDR